MLARLGLIAAIAATLALAASGPAAAKLSATASIKTASGKTRIVVALSSPKKLKGRKKVSGVSAKAGGKTYKLSKPVAKKSATVSVNLGSWQSRGYTGADATALQALAGQNIQVIVKSKSGKSTIQTTISGGSSGGGGGGGSTGGGSLFGSPGKELTGIDAFNWFSKFFLNSKFTDCPAGWPNCAVENNYVQCPSGAWEHHRLTNVSGADINAYGSYQVTGASAHVDGSWAVDYTVSAYSSTSYYGFTVAPDGSVAGRYSYNGSQEAIGPFRWVQLAGSC